MPTRVDALDQSLHETTLWLDAVAGRLGGGADRRTAMTVLGATLQALREQLAPDAAARLAALLPIPLKGAFYEDWQPQRHAPAASRAEFLERLRAHRFHDLDLAAPHGAKAALDVIAQTMPAADLADIRAALPEDLVHSLWPDGAAPLPPLSASGGPLH